MNSRKLGIVLSYVNTGLNMVCGLFLSSYLLRMLGALEYGIYQTIASFANYLVLLQFGTGTVMTRNISMCRARKALREEIDCNVNTIWTLTCMLTLLIAAIGVAFYINIDKIYMRTMSAEQLDYAKSIFLYVLIHLLSSFVMQTLNGAALAYEHYCFSSIQGILRTGLRTLLLTLFVFQYRYARIIAQIDAVLVIAQLCCVAGYVGKKCGIRLRIGIPNREIMRNTAPLCMALFLQTLVNQANNNVDKFLIGVLLSPESVAVYSVAMYIYSVFSSMTTIPISMYAPMVAKEIQLGTPMKIIERELIKPCRMTAMIGGIIYFGFLAAGRQFISVIYGESYLIAWPIAVMIMTPMYINMINGVLVNVMDALNKRMVRSIILTGITLANIVLTFIWLQSWGVIGAALATAVCTFVGQVIIMNLYYHKKLHINVREMYRESLKGVLGILAVSCGVALGIGSLIQNQLVSFFASVSLFMAVCFAGYLWKGISDEEKEMVSELIRRR